MNTTNDTTKEHITNLDYMTFTRDKEKFKQKPGMLKVLNIIKTYSYNLYDLIDIVIYEEYPGYTIDLNVISYAYVDTKISMIKALEPKKYTKLVKKNPRLIEELRFEVDVLTRKAYIEFEDIEKTMFDISRKLIYKETPFEKIINDHVSALIGKLTCDDNGMAIIKEKSIIDTFQKSISDYDVQTKIEIILNVAYKLSKFGDMNIGDYEYVLDMLSVLAGDSFCKNTTFGTLYDYKIDVNFDKCTVTIGSNSIELEPPK